MPMQEKLFLVSRKTPEDTPPPMTQHNAYIVSALSAEFVLSRMKDRFEENQVTTKVFNEQIRSRFPPNPKGDAAHQEYIDTIRYIFDKRKLQQIRSGYHRVGDKKRGYFHIMEVGTGYKMV